VKIRKDIADQNEILRLAQKWKKNQTKVILWQQREGQERHQVQTIIFSISNDTKSFAVLGSTKGWDINDQFYMYVEEGGYLLKTFYEENIPGRLILSIPQHLMLLMKDDEFVIKINNNLGNDFQRVKSLSSSNRKSLLKDLGFISLDEEDRIYKDKRSSPRARPQIQKRVLVVMESNDCYEEDLFDLSTGGMGFITERPENYLMTHTLHVLAFDRIPLDGILKGEVVGVREVDPSGITFKIGVKFLPSEV
jgi:hypothetical protein